MLKRHPLRNTQKQLIKPYLAISQKLSQLSICSVRSGSSSKQTSCRPVSLRVRAIACALPPPHRFKVGAQVGRHHEDFPAGPCHPRGRPVCTRRQTRNRGGLRRFCWCSLAVLCQTSPSRATQWHVPMLSSPGLWVSSWKLC